MTDASIKKTLYEILGIKPEATPAEIQAAYDELAGPLEDDETQPDPTHRLAWKEAHGTLSNARRRAAYDKSLRQRAHAPVIMDDDDEPSGYGRKPLLVFALVVLVTGAWWLMKSPGTSKPAIARTVAAAPAPEPAPAPQTSVNPAVAAAESARDKLLLGTWHCQGPLTGRGLDLSFAADGTYSGQSDGQPVRGDYTISGSALTLGDSGQSNRFAVEELAQQRLVISRGEGKRLSCKR